MTLFVLSKSASITITILLRAFPSPLCHDSYESHWSAKVSFHWWITTKIQRMGLLALGGSSFGLNQWCGFKQNMGEWRTRRGRR